MNAALETLGTPCSWCGGGANGPSFGIGRGAMTVGFDCSGLIQYAWAQAGVRIERTARDQWRKRWPVPEGQVQPGDLVFYDSNFVSPGPEHVASPRRRGADRARAVHGRVRDLGAAGQARIHGSGPPRWDGSDDVRGRYRITGDPERDGHADIPFQVTVNHSSDDRHLLKRLGPAQARAVLNGASSLVPC
ncbi:C40 family peptidase [Nonomuraea africana]|uniref:C40 family peptidase n=1 Tax=Nonomuraea africana TaxID=46171 RepID=UPI0033C86832